MTLPVKLAGGRPETRTSSFLPKASVAVAPGSEKLLYNGTETKDDPMRLMVGGEGIESTMT